MRPIIAWELRRRKTYLLWWTLVSAGLAALLILLYPSIHNQATNINNALNQLPDSIKALKTGSSQVDIASPVGFLNTQLYYVTLPLLQIIMAIGLGSSLIAKEEQNHTLELLLSRSIGRGRLLAAKALSGAILVLLVSLVTTLVTLVFIKIVGMQIGTEEVALTSLYTVLFSLSFGAIAFALTAANTATRRMSTAIATAASFAGYLLASLSSLTHYVKTPAKLLPYHYFDPVQLLHGHVGRGLNLYLAGIFIGSILVSILGFRQRDIS